MTSTIAFDNAKPSAGGTEYSVTSGVAKAWAYQAAPGSASNDYNVSSYTDDGVGLNDVNWTNVFAATDYAIVACLMAPSTSASYARYTNWANNNGLFTTAARVESGYESGSTAAYSDTAGNIAVFGDLA